MVDYMHTLGTKFIISRMPLSRESSAIEYGKGTKPTSLSRNFILFFFPSTDLPHAWKIRTAKDHELRSPFFK